ncbi:hypothetical protein, partial [Klebsiella pneumoniae]|uniref:hypothetical protein n=1 Tax=Klebsiella pneumoniae TaxID=573 RepID=UPI001F2C8CE3
MNIGHLNFFKVNKCGLYKVNDNNTYGLELSETFDLIQDWVGTKSLALTIPWDPKEKPNRSKCYCKDIYKDENTGDFLIMLWKSDTDRESANKQVISSQADSLIKISRIWADFFP